MNLTIFRHELIVFSVVSKGKIICLSNTVLLVWLDGVTRGQCGVDEAVV